LKIQIQQFGNPKTTVLVMLTEQQFLS